jgi:hypothetical protein
MEQKNTAEQAENVSHLGYCCRHWGTSDCNHPSNWKPADTVNSKELYAEPGRLDRPHEDAMSCGIGSQVLPGLHVKTNSPQVSLGNGVTVSKHLIDEVAVQSSTDARLAGKSRDLLLKCELRDRELRSDIDASQKFWSEMVRTMEELKQTDPKERFISYDRMSPELQRVCEAHATLELAKSEFRSAVSALLSSTPPSHGKTT